MDIEKAKNILNHYLEMEEFDSAGDFLIAIDAVLSELEKKEAIINEMAEMLSKRYCFAPIPEKCNQGKCDFDKRKCIPCIKEYFTNKVEREGK